MRHGGGNRRGSIEQVLVPRGRLQLRVASLCVSSIVRPWLEISPESPRE